MGVLESLAAGGGFSIEVAPPSRGAGLGELFEALESIMPHGPSFASVTDHPGGAAYADVAGAPLRVPLRGKPGTLGVALAIERNFGVETVPHLVCRGADRFAVEDLLIDLDYAGFRDLFVVRGDERFSPPAAAGPGGAGPGGAGPGAGSGAGGHGGHGGGRAEAYGSARDLVSHVASLNRGEYLPPARDGRPTAFRVGVAGYPGKHYAAPNREADLRRLKEKIEAGASYVITQMVFEAGSYFSFVERLRAAGIEAPVVPGLKPLVRAAQAESIPRSFFVDLPEALLASLEEARGPEAERAAGIAWTARLAEELLAGGAPGLHFFTMGKGGATRAVLDAVYGPRQRKETRCAISI